MKSGTITGKVAILEPKNVTNIWVASVDANQKQTPHTTWHAPRCNDEHDTIYNGRVSKTLTAYTPFVIQI